MYKLFFGNFPNVDAINAVAVIMAGGSGTRFWPLSTKEHPKQFLQLSGSGKSLIQDTAERLLPLINQNEILVLTGSSLVTQVRDHLPDAMVLAEPEGRNTAPALGLAAIKLLSAGCDKPMLCMAADNLIVGKDEFQAVCRDAIVLAKQDETIITIGIKPTYPETGYGYICKGKYYSPADDLTSTCYKVTAFKEKPNLEIAQEYVASGNYFWNAGMFVMRPSVLLQAIEKFMPELYAGLKQIEELIKKDNENSEKIKEIFVGFEKKSIDFGVLEKAGNVVVFAGEKFRWCDIGSWKSWADLMLEGKENYTNVDAKFIETKNCAVYSDTQDSGKNNIKKRIAIIGLENVVVVDTADGLLVCNPEYAQEVKLISD